MNTRTLLVVLMSLALGACAEEQADEEEQVDAADFTAQPARNELIFAVSDVAYLSKTSVRLQVRIASDLTQATYRDLGAKGTWKSVNLRRDDANLIFGMASNGDTFDFQVKASDVANGKDVIPDATVTTSAARFRAPSRWVYVRNRSINVQFSGLTARSVFKALREREEDTVASLGGALKCDHTPLGLEYTEIQGLPPGLVGPSYDCTSADMPARFIGTSGLLGGLDVYARTWDANASAAIFATLERKGLRIGGDYGVRAGEVSIRCLSRNKCTTTITQSSRDTNI
jgi:hypothetical protein